MAETTGISWCDSTFNPWIGCTKVSPACDHCYAERLMDTRLHQVRWGSDNPRKRTSAANWRKPPLWEREHEAFALMHGRRRRVFCASLADVFDNAVDPAWRVDLFALIADTPHLDWLLLTKRVGNAAAMIEAAVDANDLPVWPWPNVWLGATVVNQEEADRDIPKLMAVPAAKRFLSIEPILGPLSLRWLAAWPEKPPYTAQAPGGNTNHLDGLRRLDWVIVGGESGPNARPAHPDWIRALRDQCAAAGVAFHFKQWGEWRPAMGDVSQARMAVSVHDGDTFKIDRGERARSFDLLDRAQMHRVGTKAAGRLLDGIEHNGLPS